MIAYLKRWWTEAKDKLTVWLAAAAGVASQVPTWIDSLVDNADTIRGQLPDVQQHLPETHWLKVGFGVAAGVLAIAAMWARVRRNLHPQP